MELIQCSIYGQLNIPFNQPRSHLLIAIQTFPAQGIDIETFYDLDEALIKELIPKIGLRIKFKKNYTPKNKEEKRKEHGNVEVSTVLQYYYSLISFSVFKFRHIMF